MSSATKKFKKIGDKNKVIYKKPKILPQRTNNQNNENNLYKNNINYKDSGGSEK